MSIAQGTGKESMEKEGRDELGFFDKQYAEIGERLSVLLDVQREAAEVQLRQMVKEISSDLDGKLLTLDIRLEHHLQTTFECLEQQRNLLVVDAMKLVSEQQIKLERTLLRGVMILSSSLLLGTLTLAAAIWA